MKQTILAVAITIASTQAFATNFDFTNPYNHVTQPQLASEAKTRSDADKNLQSQIDQKGADINTQAKRIDQTNTNVSNLNSKVDSYAAQGTTAYNEIKGVQNAQQSQLNTVQDAAQQANVKADSAHVRLDSVETNLGNVQTAAQIANDRATSLESRADTGENAIRETNGAVQSVNADLQSSKAAGVAIATGLNDKIEGVASQGAAEFTKTNNNVKAVDDKVNVVNQDLQASKNYQLDVNKAQQAVNNSQANTNTQVQGQLSSVQTSAQNAQSTANVALSIGVSNTASIAKNTNDIQVNAQGIVKNSSDIKATNEVVTAQGNTLSEHTTQIRSNTNNIVTLNEVQQQHSVQLGSNTKQLSNHETRITNIEDYSRDMDTRLSGRLDSQQSEIRGLKRDVNKVGNIAVGALAVAGHQFSTDYQAGPQVALSGATMAGYHAVAIGFGGAVSESLFLNAAFTSAGSQTGAVVSGTYRLK